MNAERRSVPRSSALSCPWCFSGRMAAHHLRDTGDLDTATAISLGYCPTLAAKRNPAPLTLCPTDAREAARLDEWSARLTDDDMASAFAASTTSPTTHAGEILSAHQARRISSEAALLAARDRLAAVNEAIEARP